VAKSQVIFALKNEGLIANRMGGEERFIAKSGKGT
jgi:hypothetical protein